MAETADIAVLDGEDAGTTPWEFTSIVEEAGNGFDLDAAAALHGDYGYKVSFGGSNDAAYGKEPMVSVDPCYIRCYFSFPVADYPFSTEATLKKFRLFRAVDASSNVLFELWFRANQSAAQIYQIGYGDNTTSYAITLPEAVDIPLGMSHFVDVGYKKGLDDSGQVEFRLDGNTFYTKAITTSKNSLELRIGSTYAEANPANGEYFYLDDLLVSTTGPIGGYSEAAGTKLVMIRK